MGRRKKYAKDFKESAIEYHQDSGKTVKEVAEELGIERSSLSRWLMEKREEEKSGIRAFPGQGNPRDEELYRLRKEIADLKEINEILKKATAFFATNKTR